MFCASEPRVFAWSTSYVRECWSTFYRLLKPEYQTAEEVQKNIVDLPLYGAGGSTQQGISSWLSEVYPTHFVPAIANQAYTILL